MLRLLLSLLTFLFLTPVALIVQLERATAYSSGDNPNLAKNSVFTVERGGVHSGCIDSKPNDQSIDISTIEFEDNGSFSKGSQLDAAVGCIDHARSENPNGAIVVLFIHGWHHNAAWDPGTNGGDPHFMEFRNLLMSLALREAERYFSGPAGRRVVGIYVGWNGDPKQGMLHHLHEDLSFWNRYEVASRIAGSADMRQMLASVIDHTKQSVNSAQVESPLIMVGHSMGALILETAFLALLQQSKNTGSTVPSNAPSSCAAVKSGDRPTRFPDLVLLLNAAAESKIDRALGAQIEQRKIRKLVACGFPSFYAPLIISATSEGDTATKNWFPAGKQGHRTAAHIPEMLTHRLVSEPIGSTCSPRGAGQMMPDFGQSWHCLRQPIIQNGLVESVALDFPQASVPRDPCHVRYRLQALHRTPTSQWIFQVPTNVIKDHNDIFNPQARLLITGLTQISGSVMSLARDWNDTFEQEEGKCSLHP